MLTLLIIERAAVAYIESRSTLDSVRPNSDLCASCDARLTSNQKSVDLNLLRRTLGAPIRRFLADPLVVRRGFDILATKLMISARLCWLRSANSLPIRLESPLSIASVISLSP